jgi:phosphatidate cytidylyltransferase
LLKTRILTAVILAPLAITVVFFAPDWMFRLTAALLLMIGCWEFHRLAKLNSTATWILYSLQAGLIILMYLNWENLNEYASVILVVSCIAWILMFLRLFGYRDNRAAGLRFQAISFVSALASITSCWFAISWLRDQAHGEYLILLLLIIIWAADVGAYFSGRSFGRTKLAPSISPKKTWEGVIGGILLAGLAAVLVGRFAPGIDSPFLPLIALTAVTVLTSICGDLFISLHKRTVNLKDAGSLFPGHGGVLDRLDSLLPGSVFFATGVWILGS